MLPDDRFFAFSNTFPPAPSAFQRLNGGRVGNLVRFLADGTMDPSFALDEELFGYTINAVAAAPDGKFVVAAIPQYRASDVTNRVLRLNANGSIDRTFDAGPGAPQSNPGSATIQAIAVDASGRPIVGASLPISVAVGVGGFSA